MATALVEEIPQSVLIQVEFAATNRIEWLQKLRRERHMATTESGTNQGRVDLDDLRSRRRRSGLDAAKIRASRADAAETLALFRELAPKNGIDPEPIIADFRNRMFADLKSRPQWLNRGTGYYPGPCERHA